MIFHLLKWNLVHWKIERTLWTMCVYPRAWSKQYKQDQQRYGINLCHHQNISIINWSDEDLFVCVSKTIDCCCICWNKRQLQVLCAVPMGSTLVERSFSCIRLTFGSEYWLYAKGSITGLSHYSCASSHGAYLKNRYIKSMLNRLADFNYFLL